jgi:hypothetical protein
VYVLEKAILLDNDNNDLKKMLKDAKIRFPNGNNNNRNNNNYNNEYRNNTNETIYDKCYKIMLNCLKIIKELFQRMLLKLYLFYTSIKEEHRILIFIGILIFSYFLFKILFASNNSGNYRQKSYNDFGGNNNNEYNNNYDNNNDNNYNNHNNNNNNYRYENNRQNTYSNRHDNRYNQNHGFGSSSVMSWPLWGGIVLGAWKLPPYFENVLG